ncbi:MAG: hypothetical protein GF313_01710 [Caldithrix sp.]|nr:hypothetical protein [Caldithrix sp.]
MSTSKAKIERKRVFGGSWFLVIAPFFACAIRIWYEFGKKDLFGQGDSWIQVLINNGSMSLDIMGWFIGGAILYYFASLVPKDILVKRAEKYDEESAFSFLFNDSFKSYTISFEAIDENGNRYEGAETISGAWDIGFVPLKLFLWFLFLFAKASFVPYYAAFNLIRNYPLVWISRLFKKKEKFQPKYGA